MAALGALGAQAASSLFGGRSFTQTIHQENKKLASALVPHNSILSTSFSVDLRKPMKWSDKRGVFSYSHQYTNGMGNNQGRQEAGYTSMMLLIRQLVPKQLIGYVLNSETPNNAIATATSNRTPWNVSPFDMNPFRRVTGTGFGNSTNPNEAFIQPGEVNYNDRVYIKNITGMMQFTNASNTATFVDLVFCTPKTMLETQTYSSGTEPTSYVNASLPIEVWNFEASGEGLGQGPFGAPTMTAVFPGKENHRYYGSTFRGYPGWHKKWKIVKDMKFTLQAGSTYTIKYNIGVHKIVDQRWLKEQLDNGIQYIANTTIVPFYVMRPTVVAVEPGESERVSEATVPAVNIAHINTFKVNYVFLPPDETINRINRVLEIYPGSKPVKKILADDTAGDVINAGGFYDGTGYNATNQ